MKKILTVAGSDCSGGAGIQADIKTITVHKMYAMSVITSVTAQNTTGVYGVCDISAEVVKRQLECVFEDIYPDAVKIGMVSNAEIIDIIAKTLKKYSAKNIVLDTVMVSTSGRRLLQDDAVNALITKLLPIADVVTPNIPEAQTISGLEIKNESDMIKAAKIISKAAKGSVLIKGGHSNGKANDLLYDGKNAHWLFGERIENSNTHGTGCTLSSAIACNLANGLDIKTAAKEAKEYLGGAIAAGLDLGKGSGPMNHMYLI